MKNWKTIKIFVSSTFKDMDVERDALRNIVLPRLNEHFAPHKRNIQIIDLRDAYSISAWTKFCRANLTLSV